MADRGPYEGQQLGNYYLTHLLGQGSFADVYLGKHIYLNTQAAIKVLHGQLAGNEVETTLDGASEILSLTGSLSKDGAHLHMAVANASVGSWVVMCATETESEPRRRYCSRS